MAKRAKRTGVAGPRDSTAFGQAVARQPPRPNRLMTAAELAEIAACCLCGGRLDPGGRYLCRPCGEAGAAIAASTIDRERGERLAARGCWLPIEPRDPFGHS
jgi:hypothetical protein